MNSGNTSHEEDGLVSLVQGMLKARVSGQEPPPYVWKQIKQELEAEGSTSCRRELLSLAEGRRVLT